MTRQLELFNVRYKNLRHPEEREFVGGRDFRLNYRAITKSLSLPLSARTADLLRIAATTFFVDRLMKRDRRQGPLSWSRQIECQIEVRDSEFWNIPNVHETVEQCLGFVSGDQWKLILVGDRRSIPLTSKTLFSADHLFDIPPVISLYSGGLDSAAGLALRLSGRKGRKPLIPCVVRHRADINNKATLQIATLSKHFGVELHAVTAAMVMSSPKKLVGHEELSQRSRGFLFVSVGGVTAGATGASDLELYESGVGAVNVPLLAGMEGSQATRSAHPVFLRMMSTLLQLVFDRPINVTLPFMDLTKGEIVTSLANDALVELARSTVSCAHFPVRHTKGVGCKSCGLCPACIFRRVALNAAGIRDDPHSYQFDLLDARSSQLDSKRLRCLMAYLRMVDSLGELDEGRLPLLVSHHLRSTGVIEPADSLSSFVDLFHRYRSDWYRLLQQARRNGCAWATRIEIPGQAA